LARRVAVFGTRYVITAELFGASEEVEVIQPKPDGVEIIHNAYVELAATGRAYRGSLPVWAIRRKSAGRRLASTASAKVRHPTRYPQFVTKSGQTTYFCAEFVFLRQRTVRHSSRSRMANQESMNNCLLLLLIVSTLFAATPRAVTGASVTSLQFVDQTATVTISNTSQRDITGYSLGITAHLVNGSTSYSERTEDYGPAAFTHKALHPGETSEQTITFGPEVGSVNAEVVVAIYDDQTAEVKNERAFQDTITMRQSIAQALQLSATVFRDAAADANPSARAQHDFAELIKNADASHANKHYLESHEALAKNAPAGEERQFFQAHADRLQQQADLFARHAQIRSLPLQ
jgi:hypothetical protein